MTPIDKAIDRTDNVLKENSIATTQAIAGVTTKDEVRLIFGQPVPSTLTDESVDIYAAVQGDGAEWMVIPGSGAMLRRVDYAVALFHYDSKGILISIDFLKRNHRGDRGCQPIGACDVFDLVATLEIGQSIMHLIGIFERPEIDTMRKSFDKPIERCNIYVFHDDEEESYSDIYLLRGRQEKMIFGGRGYVYLEHEPGVLDLRVDVLDIWGQKVSFREVGKNGEWRNELQLNCVAGETFFINGNFELSFWGTTDSFSLDIIDEQKGKRMVQSRRLLRN